MYLMHLYLTTVFALICAASGDSIQTFYFDDLCPYGNGNAVVKIGSTAAGTNSSAILRAVRDGIIQMYRMDSRCTVKVIPPPFHNIVVSVKKIEVRTPCLDNVTLTDSVGNSQTYCDFYSNGEETQSRSFIGNLTVDFRTASILSGSNLGFDGFVLTLTAYESGFCFSNYQFKCTNLRCIAKELKCDGHNHCGDKSEQRQCDVATTCASYQFRCTSGLCISSLYVCDGDNDCGDWSDERNCVTTCASYQFRCTNGNCIRSSYVCDGDNDCGDWSDERNCGDTSYSSRTGTSVGRVIGSIFGCFFFFIAVVAGAVYYRSRANRIVQVVNHPSPPYSITHPPPPPPSQVTFPTSPPMPPTQPYANPYPPLGKEIQDNPPPYSTVAR